MIGIDLLSAAQYSPDSLLGFLSREDHFMPAALAAQPELDSDPQYQPGVRSAGMRLLKPQYVVLVNVHQNQSSGVMTIVLPRLSPQAKTIGPAAGSIASIIRILYICPSASTT